MSEEKKFSTNIIFIDMFERLGISLRKAASMIGVSATSVNNWKNFVHPMPILDLKKFNEEAKEYLSERGLVCTENYKEEMEDLELREQISEE